MTYITYEKLRIKMIQCGLQYKDLELSSHTCKKLRHDEPVSMEVLTKLCDFFRCNLSDLANIMYIEW